MIITHWTYRISTVSIGHFISQNYDYNEPLAHAQMVPPAGIVIDGEEEFEVEQIVNHRTRRRKIEFLIKWKGHPCSQNTWEGVGQLLHCPRLVAEYRKRHGLSFGALGREVL